MRDGPDKGTMILQCAWRECRGKEHNKAGFLVGKVLHFFPHTDPCVGCRSPRVLPVSFTKHEHTILGCSTQSAQGMVPSELLAASGNTNACLEERQGRGGKISVNNCNFNSALACR